LASIQPVACSLASRIITIRAATAADVPSLTGMLLTTAADSPNVVTTPAEMAARLNRLPRIVAEYRINPGRLWLIALDGPDVVGELSCRCGSPARLAHNAQLGMSVARTHRRMGIAHALLSTAVRWATEHPSIRRITLAVVADHAVAINLYRKHGFVAEGRRHGHVRGTADDYADDLMMACFVKSG